jgi:hypothetical protein
MSQDDFYIAAGRRQLAVLEAARASALADLQSHRLNGDQESAAETIQTLAGLDAQSRELTALYNQYAASQTPPPPPTLEERRAKPWERMDYSDVWEMSRSKYGPPDEASFRAGIAEAQRRRSRGE